MQPFSITLADGARIHITQKISGRRRSIRLIFFKIRRRKTVIAYSIQIQEPETSHYTIYKVKKTGNWQRTVDSDQGTLSNSEKIRTQEIKSAIDQYESGIGPFAYKDLFW